MVVVGEKKVSVVWLEMGTEEAEELAHALDMYAQHLAHGGGGGGTSLVDRQRFCESLSSMLTKRLEGMRSGQTS